MSADYLLQLCGSLAGGLKYTVSLFFITVLVSIPIGLLLSFTRVGRSRVLKGLVGAYVWVMRGTPLLLQLYFFCYGITFLPGIGDYLVMDRFQAAILAFILNYAAYFCEIFRAGIQAIPKGQYEAARTLGMNYVQTMRRIILPQVFRIILPPVSNETITLVKDTSLIYVLAMNDLLRTTRNLVQRDFSITPFLVAGVFYLLMTLVLTYGFDKLEKRFSKYD